MERPPESAGRLAARKTVVSLSGPGSVSLRCKAKQWNTDLTERLEMRKRVIAHLVAWQEGTGGLCKMLVAVSATSFRCDV